LSKLVDQEQRCGHYNNQNKKEDDPDSIGPVYLIVGSRTEEQSRQASCTLVRHERQPLITFSQDFANQRATLNTALLIQPVY